MNSAVSFILKAVDRATGPVRSVRRALGGLRGQASQAARSFGLTSVVDSVRRLGGSFRKLGGQIRNMFGGATLLTGGGLVAGLGLLVRQSVTAGDSLDKLSRRTGLTVERLQELRYAAERGGATSEEFEAAIRSLTKNIGEASNGTGEAKELFEALGIQMTDSAGKVRPVADVYVEVADKIALIEDPAQRAAVAQKLMEEAGVKLVPSMLGGAEGLEEMAKRARELGIASEEQARQSAEMQDRMTDVGRAIQGAGYEITSKLLPVLGPLIDRFVAFIAQNRELIGLRVGEVVSQIATAFEAFDFRGFIDGLQETIAGVRSFIEMIGGWKIAAVGIVALLNIDTVAALLSVGKSTISLTSSLVGMGAKLSGLAVSALPSVIAGVKMFTGVFSVLSKALLANPIGLIVTAIAGLAWAIWEIYDNWDTIVPWAKDLWESVKSIFFSGMDAIMSVISNFAPVKVLRGLLQSLSDSLPGWMKTGLKTIGIEFDDTPAAAGAGTGLPADTASAVDRAADRRVAANVNSAELQGEILTRIEVVGQVQNVQTRSRQRGQNNSLRMPVDVGMNAAAQY